MNHILAIDQGTSSTKALVFNQSGEVLQKSSANLSTNYQDNGFVEQKPEDIYQSVLQAVKSLDLSNTFTLGISNQRETFLLWDKTGKPASPAIVWACKRSVSICQEMSTENSWINQKTGLIIDPYFSGTKLLWLIKNHPEIKKKIQAGELYFGTIDTWLLFKLSQGKAFKTDYTNASRTLFFNIHSLTWDMEILKKWGLENLQLPEILPSSAYFGETDFEGLIPHKIKIQAMVGDSHASLFGESCFEKGDTKITMGTGSSLLMNIGKNPLPSKNKLLTTIGWSTQTEIAYAWEGAIVSCGSMISWLKDSLNLFENAKDSANMAKHVENNGGVYLVPGFAGLGAPIWKMDRKASFVGLNFGTTKNHLVRATLEAIIFQIKDVLDAMEQDLEKNIEKISMHGGLSKNEFIQKYLPAFLLSKIEVQENEDISGLGAALLAGLSANIYPDLKSISSQIKKKDLAKDPSLKSYLTKEFIQWKKIIEENPF